MLDAIYPSMSPTEHIKEIHTLLDGPEPDRTLLAYALYGQGCRDALEARREQRKNGQPLETNPHVRVQLPPRLNSVTFYIRPTEET